MARAGIPRLYYITHINNVPSILTRGILSHESIEKEAISYTPIYDAQIVANRRERQTPDGKSLWSFANLYFQARNPMLYRVLCEKPITDVVVLEVQPTILNGMNIFISTGGLGSHYSEILPASKGKRMIPQIRKATDKEWWKAEDGSKREMMAECLVPDVIPPDSISAIYVASYDVASAVKAMLPQSNLYIIPQPKMFFRPERKKTITTHLSLVEGDMFFSRMNTLTISVNCVGIMGKGLASRAKYQVPDMYVLYQDLCRKRILQMGKPYLYKRETSFDYQLADEPETLTSANAETWFLLFPTKQHWRERADIHGIEEGLQWLRDNCTKEDIKSLAIPALGCGLGWLEWRDVGPLLCRYTYPMKVPVEIYLPTEKKIPDEFLSKEFLLAQVD